MKPYALALLIGSILLGACSGAPASSGTAVPTETAIPANTGLSTPTAPAAEPQQLSVIDALGRQVDFKSPPMRIVIAGKALFMIADAAYMFPQAPGRIAAMGDAGQGATNFIALVDPDYQAKASLEQDAGAEQIAAVQPDLVILKSYLAETVGKPIQALGIPIVYVDLETPEQYERDIAILGKVFQDEARARQITQYYLERMNEVKTATQGIQDKPRVLLLYYTDKDGAVAFNVPPMEWMQTQIVQLAGGEPVWSSANPGKGWTKVTLEQIAAWEADQIFIVSYFKDPAEVVAGLKSDPQWQALRAVQGGRLYAFPGDLYSWDQPDARWILGLKWMAAKLHPDRFPQFDIIQEARQFYQTLYGLDAQFFEEKIRPTFKGDLP
ncbi:MAG: ABC transporter substrate-binding protein [Anaerolineae bacterium]|nr:ABC transporter substrate-binding protein [Anaerolineae bacterium]